MFEDGERKKRGRFIKKDSFLMKIVDIEEYSFSEVLQTVVLYSDNLSNNVYHARLHDEGFLKKTVKEAEQVHTELIDKALRPGVIMPRDFTAEWHEDKKKSRTIKKRLLDEDDEIELAIAMEEDRRRRHEMSKQQKSGFPTKNIMRERVQQPPQELATESEVKDKGASFEAISADTVDQLEDLRNDAQILSPKMVPSNMNQSVSKNISEDDIENRIAKGIEAKLQELDDQIIAESERIRNESREDGYKEGLDEAKKKTDEVYSKMADSIEKINQEFSHLKKQILLSSQDNFKEVTLAIGEALLEKDFQINPDHLAKLIKRTIDESIKDDEFKIHMHPDTIASLDGYLSNEVRQSLISDDKVSPLDFKIDSKLTSINSNLRDMVKGLLDHADIDLFAEKVGA